MFIEPAVINRAPQPLELVRAFINTWNIEHKIEQLTTPENLQGWLVEHGLINPAESVCRADLEPVITLREALRSLLVANNGGASAAAVTTTLNTFGESLYLRVQFTPAGLAQLGSAESGVAGALGRLLSIVTTAMLDGSWFRLKACHNQGCRWAFYDLSKNRSATWCATSICGSRLKAKAYRQRQRAGRRTDSTD
jgi:predicted RNA-binding Zn ribbon-like protein